MKLNPVYLMIKLVILFIGVANALNDLYSVSQAPSRPASVHLVKRGKRARSRSNSPPREAYGGNETLMRQGRINSGDRKQFTDDLIGEVVGGYAFVHKDWREGNGIDRPVAGANNGTPMHVAAERGYDHHIKRLADSGANSNAIDRYEQTPMHKAAIYGNPQCIRALAVANGAVNKPDKYGNTPLHEAAACNMVANIRELADRGGNLNARNKMGLTPLEVAEQRQSFAAVEELRNQLSKHEREN